MAAVHQHTLCYSQDMQCLPPARPCHPASLPAWWPVSLLVVMTRGHWQGALHWLACCRARIAHLQDWPWPLVGTGPHDVLTAVKDAHWQTQSMLCNTSAFGSREWQHKYLKVQQSTCLLHQIAMTLNASCKLQTLLNGAIQHAPGICWACSKGACWWCCWTSWACVMPPGIAGDIALIGGEAARRGCCPCSPPGCMPSCLMCPWGMG